jgi:hypothetical protein
MLGFVKIIIRLYDSDGVALYVVLTIHSLNKHSNFNLREPSLRGLSFRSDISIKVKGFDWTKLHRSDIRLLIISL